MDAYGLFQPELNCSRVFRLLRSSRTGKGVFRYVESDISSANLRRAARGKTKRATIQNSNGIARRDYPQYKNTPMIAERYTVV